MDSLEKLTELANQLTEDINRHIRLKDETRDLGYQISKDRQKVKRAFNKVFKEIFVHDIKWVLDGRFSGHYERSNEDSITYLNLEADSHNLNDLFNEIKNSWGSFYTTFNSVVRLEWHENSRWRSNHERILVRFNGTKADIDKYMEKYNFNIIGKLKQDAENNTTSTEYF